MKDYEIIKCKGKFEVRHIYGRHVYCKTFKYKWHAELHMFLKEIGFK